MKPNSPEWEQMAFVVAHYASQGEKQQVIADKLRISQPKVSRLRAFAEGRGWLLDMDPEFRVPPADRALWDEAQKRFVTDDELSRELRRLSNGRLRQLQVVYGPDDYFYPEAARTMHKMLGRVRKVGVTWGRALHRVVASLERIVHQPLRPSSHIQFIPLCGEPFEDSIDPVDFSSSTLALRLSRIFNGPAAAPPPSIVGINSFIPQTFSDAEAETIHRFVRLNKGHRAIFGANGDGVGENPKPHVRGLRMIVTGVGVTDAKNCGIFLQDRKEKNDLSEEDMEQVLGDMSGILVVKSSCPPRIRARLEALNDRSTGLRLDHITECASTSGDKDPGVVVVAVYANRAKMILRCVKEGWINSLIISKRLAGDISALVKNRDMDH